MEENCSKGRKSGRFPRGGWGMCVVPVFVPLDAVAWSGDVVDLDLLPARGGWIRSC